MQKKDSKSKERRGSTSNGFASILGKSALAADLSISKYLAVCSEKGPLRPVMKLLEISGHGVPWIAFSVYALMTTTDELVTQVTLNLLLALVIDLIIVGILKIIARRSRPCYNKGDMLWTVSVDNYSFPSGHATRAAMVTCYILVHFKLGFPVRVLLRIWCLIIGLSRVVLGRHHISDVIAGFIIGYLEFVFIEYYIFLSNDACTYVMSHFHSIKQTYT